MVNVGIDDVAIHFPRLYMDMRDFAEMRGADYGKLNKGLGLKAMAIPDVHEDTATMAYKLFQLNKQKIKIIKKTKYLIF